MMAKRNHEHFCYRCFGLKATEGVWNHWWRCADPKCVMGNWYKCKKHQPTTSPAPFKRREAS